MRMIAMRPNGVDLSKEPALRSQYQQEMGKENIQKQLDNLAKDPRAIESLQQMEDDRNNNRKGKEPRDYWVNAQIGRIFNAASQRAWNRVSRDPRAQALIRQKDLLQNSRYAQSIGQHDLSNRRYDELQELRQLSGVN